MTHLRHDKMARTQKNTQNDTKIRRTPRRHRHSEKNTFCVVFYFLLIYFYLHFLKTLITEIVKCGVQVYILSLDGKTLLFPLPMFALKLMMTMPLKIHTLHLYLNET